MPTYGFFYFVFKPLEVSEHFTLVLHGVDPGVPRLVVDKEHVIYRHMPNVAVWVGPHTSEWNTSSRSLLTFPCFRNGCWCCLLNCQASHTPSISFCLKVRSLMKTLIDCISLCLWRLMWPIRVCHNSMSVSALVPFENMVDFILCESTMNIRPSLHPQAMIRPSFLMKQPPWSNRTCMPCSTIWPTETKFFVIVETCKTFSM